jgi:hypothetical protein
MKIQFECTQEILEHNPHTAAAQEISIHVLPFSKKVEFPQNLEDI